MYSTELSGAISKGLMEASSILAVSSPGITNNVHRDRVFAFGLQCLSEVSSNVECVQRI